MLRGVIFALSACFVWGLSFIVPEYEKGYTPIEVTLGRYLVFGIISLFFLYRSLLRGGCRYPLPVWRKAAYYSLAANIGSYTFLVFALESLSPAITALIVGVSPVTIALYGNWKERECRFRSLMLPSVLVVLGLVAINIPTLVGAECIDCYAEGLLCGFGSLGLWSWFVVGNARFLKDHPEVTTADWTTLMGAGTLFWVIIMGMGVALFFSHQVDYNKYFVWSDGLKNFLIGCAILGILCSGIGSFFWNRASYYLPVSLAGQLIVFQTIFGLIFAYTLDQELPPASEIAGIALLVFAVGFSIRRAMHTQATA